MRKHRRNCRDYLANILPFSEGTHPVREGACRNIAHMHRRMRLYLRREPTPQGKGRAEVQQFLCVWAAKLIKK